jgi:hypothetical protein
MFCFDNFSDDNLFSEETFISYDLPQPFSQPTVDVVLLNASKTNNELFPGIPATFSPNGDLDLHTLINTLKQEGFLLGTNMIFYYSQTADLHIYCGKDPLPASTIIPSYDIVQAGGRKSVTLRVKPVERPKVEQCEVEIKPELKLEFEDSSLYSDCEQDSSPKDGKRRRHKERKISEAIELVLKWRKLYSGYVDTNTGKMVKYSLEDAAKKVGVAKKSLDDYLLMIKHAKTYGFDFQAHHDEKFGAIRSFVKKCKNLSSKGESPSSNPLDSESTDDGRDTEVVAKCHNSKKIRKDQVLSI